MHDTIGYPMSTATAQPAPESRQCRSCRGALPPPAKFGRPREVCRDCKQLRAWIAACRRMVEARPELERVLRRELGPLGPLAALPDPDATRPPYRNDRAEFYLDAEIRGHITGQSRRQGVTKSEVARKAFRAWFGLD